MEWTRANAWTQLKSGGIFYPLRASPNWGSVTLADIAHGLARQYRFGGHLADYLVAEHCCHLYDLVPSKLRPLAIMHDNVEGLGLPDLQLPFKETPELQGYKSLDHRLTEGCLEFFGINLDDYLTFKDFDVKIAVSEAKAMFRDGRAKASEHWKAYLADHEGLPYNLGLHYWERDEAAKQWLLRARTSFPNMS